jgi:LmbE family N-acetylglucosaminyl deacetylase
MMVRLKSSARLRRALHAYLRSESPHRMNSAVVFAPHQDDETLGCGGTIILKREAGTPVTLVFMTDGSRSHRQFMKEDELRQIRHDEALEAAKTLGLKASDVHFLNYVNGELSGFREAAVREVLAILQRHRPSEVFVPYRNDGPPDHEATYRIVLEATGKAGLPLRLFEYPIWFWNHWPWVSQKLLPNRSTGKAIIRMLRAGFGLRAFEVFRSGVFIADILERKRKALGQHQSQMTALIPGSGWPTLSDVSDGEFLNCFFQEYEVFRCRTRFERVSLKRTLIFQSGLLTTQAFR